MSSKPPLSKKKFITSLALRMEVDEKTAEKYLNDVTETLYESFKKGYGVTLTGFGNFFLEVHVNFIAFKFNPS